MGFFRHLTIDFTEEKVLMPGEGIKSLSMGIRTEILWKT